MNKRKTPSNQTQPTLKDFLDRYDAVSLIGSINTFENSTAWKLYQAYARYVQRQFEVTALDQMALVGTDKNAAYASGYAKCAEDMVEKFMEGLKQTVLQTSPVVENARPEE